jgi:frataxin
MFHLDCLQEHTSAFSPKPSRQAPVNLHSTRLQGLNRPGTQLLRFFQTESDFHTAADETLEGIQDAIDEALEAKGVPDFEVTFASGVLTLVFPPHGTWVINKQTPNRQLWWSSPISGPRRYEYEDDEWVFTRDDSHSMTLEKALKEELEQIYDVHVDL